MSLLMPTDLFPKNNEPITIKQGQLDDCFILATLISIMENPKGLAIIKSMFHEIDGRVEVRIKRNKLVHNLLHHKDAGALDGKYHHKFDFNTEEDVFTIFETQLDSIDREIKGVRSNSLAVKILEHIITYYYEPQFPGRQIVNGASQVVTALPGFSSIIQHNRTAKTRSALSPSDFVATLFGIEAFDISVNKISSLIAFKQKYPTVPLYISMNYNKVDSQSILHKIHALSVKEIRYQPDAPGGYEFILINPWNNTRTETHDLVYILSTSPTFAIYNLDKELKQQICTSFSIPFVDNDPPAKLKKLLFETTNVSAAISIFDAIKVLQTPEETQAITNQIQNYMSSQVNVRFLKQMIQECKVTHAVALMKLIHNINNHNKELAKVLFHLTKDNIPSLFTPTMTFYDCICDVSKDQNLYFKKWFLSMARPTQTIPGAQDAADKANANINDASSFAISQRFFQRSTMVTHPSNSTEFLEYKWMLSSRSQ